MSEKIRTKNSYADIFTKEGAKAKLNFVINFERFIEENTGVNIGLWLNKIYKKDNIKTSFEIH